MESLLPVPAWRQSRSSCEENSSSNEVVGKVRSDFRLVIVFCLLLLPFQIAFSGAEKHRFDVRLKPMPTQGFRFQHRRVNKAECVRFHCKLVDIVADGGNWRIAS